MNEDYLHYIWRYGLYDSKCLHTTDGKSVSVVFAGKYNRDAGPDFLEAKLSIDGVLWIGHVEIHIKASDWKAHKHHLDPAYDPVIMHVVYSDDVEVLNSRGVFIPTMVMKIKSDYHEKYLSLMSEFAPIPCSGRWQLFSPVKVESAILAMGVERMEQRLSSLQQSFKNNKGSMKDLFLQFISRGFGFGKNQVPMEELARSINSVWIEKHYGNLFQIESLFFGQSGFLPERATDVYTKALKTEYAYLSKKHNIIQPDVLGWKFLRMRPGNFPPVRVAQLCAYLWDKQDFVDQSLSIADSADISKIEINTSYYWKSHYDFDKEISGTIPEMGESSRLLLMINVFLPLMGFYKSSRGDKEAMEAWLDQLESLPPEENSVTAKWREAGFRIPNAFYSQAFFYMYRSFCVEKKCIQCKIGQLILGSNS